MKILDALQERARETGELQRAVVLGPETGALHTSAVLVRVPPRHEFPVHTHPRSEDCFFVLAGAGEAFGLDRRFPISEFAGVWIGAGVPHGLVAGPSGMLEVGFQSPPDPTAVPFDARAARSLPSEMLAERIPTVASASARWLPVFPSRSGWRYLDPHYAVLDGSQQLRAEADGYELIVVVARGAIELPESGARAGAIAAVQFSPGEAAVVRGLEPATLLLGVRAIPSGEYLEVIATRP